MNFLLGIDAIVLGLGESGLAMARWCVRCGASVRVWDSREAPPHLETLRSAAPETVFFTGPLPAVPPPGLRLVLKSPGLAPGDARIAPFLAAARAAGIEVTGELGLFACALADLKAASGYAPQLLAITGTNGKTTTTALSALLVDRAGRRVAAAGNIGPTMLDTLADALGSAPGWSGAVSIDEAIGAPEDAASDASIGEPHDESHCAAVDAPADEPVDADDSSNSGGTDETGATADAGDTGDTGNSGGTGGTGDSSDADDRSVVVGSSDFAMFGAAVDVDALPEVWVLELSSFQLADAGGFEATAAAVLNLSQDHLDWHGDMAAYADAKARVFAGVATRVVNRDDPLVMRMLGDPPPAAAAKGGRAGRAARNSKPAAPPVASARVVRYGLDAPRQPGDFGLVDEDGITWLVRATRDDDGAAGRRRAARAPTGDAELHLQRLMPADALRLRGRHNAGNALAALALATAAGCPLAPMLHALRDYRGEPHRIAPVATIGGVEAVDDSKGTNVGATVAAIESLGFDKAPGRLVAILGGDGKGQDFSPLADPVHRFVRAAALIGRDAEAIASALSAAGATLSRHDSLESAVRWSFGQAQAGDAVLLSPACASFDMFRNYAHRAEAFVAAVATVAAESGEVFA